MKIPAALSTLQVFPSFYYIQLVLPVYFSSFSQAGT